MSYPPGMGTAYHVYKDKLYENGCCKWKSLCTDVNDAEQRLFDGN